MIHMCKTQINTWGLDDSLHSRYRGENKMEVLVQAHRCSGCDAGLPRKLLFSLKKGNRKLSLHLQYLLGLFFVCLFWCFLFLLEDTRGQGKNCGQKM